MTKMAEPYINDSGLQTNVFGPVEIPDGTSISFYESGTPSDLHVAFGGANIHGSLWFETKRDASNPSRVLMHAVTINAIVEDTYDFDWTREAGSQTRKGATVQIGWEPPSRNGGKIFATETELKRRYEEDYAIWRFNNYWWIDL